MPGKRGSRKVKNASGVGASGEGRASPRAGGLRFYSLFGDRLVERDPEDSGWKGGGIASHTNEIHVSTPVKDWAGVENLFGRIGSLSFEMRSAPSPEPAAREAEPPLALEPRRRMSQEGLGTPKGEVRGASVQAAAPHRTMSLRRGWEPIRELTEEEQFASAWRGQRESFAKAHGGRVIPAPSKFERERSGAFALYRHFKDRCEFSRENARSTVFHTDSSLEKQDGRHLTAEHMEAVLKSPLKWKKVSDSRDKFDEQDFGRYELADGQSFDVVFRNPAGGPGSVMQNPELLLKRT